MNSHVIDWLQKDKQYAKALVGLVGIRTRPVEEGVSIGLTVKWDGKEFVPPLRLRLNASLAALEWNVPSLTNKIFREAFAPLIETFRELTIPPRLIRFEGIVNPQTKHVHFRGLHFFPDSIELNSEELIQLGVTSVEPGRLAETVKELQKMKRRLKGMGFYH